MRGIVGAAVWVLVAAPCLAQVPSTDLFLVELDGVTVGSVHRLTDRDGYDNQPMFLPAGDAIVYSSSADGATDIWRLDPATGERVRITDTAESEYSPTPIPGRRAVSVVRDYGDLEQQLWAFPLGEGSPELLLPDVSPVGYHAWVDERRVLLFVLGEPMTLRLASVGPGEGTVLAPDPGRALARIPDRDEMSWVDKANETWWLTAYDPGSGDMRRLIAMPARVEDYAWSPDGAVWCGRGSTLLRWRAGNDDWVEVGDLSASGVDGITRLTFSPDGKRMVLVGER